MIEKLYRFDFVQCLSAIILSTLLLVSPLSSRVSGRRLGRRHRYSNTLASGLVCLAIKWVGIQVLLLRSFGFGVGFGFGFHGLQLYFDLKMFCLGADSVPSVGFGQKSSEVVGVNSGFLGCDDGGVGVLDSLLEGLFLQL